MSCYRTFFHRVPCGVSSIAIPLPSSSPRIASAAAKSRRARASRRAVSRSSTHAASASSISASPGHNVEHPVHQRERLSRRARARPHRSRPRRAPRSPIRMNLNSAPMRLRGVQILEERRRRASSPAPPRSRHGRRAAGRARESLREIADAPHRIRSHASSDSSVRFSCLR